MDSLRVAALDLKSKIDLLISEMKADPRLVEIQRSIAALHSLEDLLGDPQTEISGPWVGTHSHAGEQVQSTRLTFRNDEFYGLEALEAAKRVLKKMQRSAKLSEIISGIRTGGGDPGPEDRLRVSLARSTMEVAKIGDDLFGLVEFYPHLKRGTPGRRKKNGMPTKDDDTKAPSSEDQPEGEESTETPDAGTSGESEGGS